MTTLDRAHCWAWYFARYAWASATSRTEYQRRDYEALAKWGLRNASGEWTRARGRK